MFVAGMGAAQFAMPAAVDLLRSLRRPDERADAVHLAASDPANPYGGLLPWSDASPDHSMARAGTATCASVMRGRPPTWPKLRAGCSAGRLRAARHKPPQR